MTKVNILYSKTLAASKQANKPIFITVIKNLLSNLFPFTALYYFMFHAWIILHVAIWVAPSLGLTLELDNTWTTILYWLDIAAVVYILPNFLRTFCLHFISSNLHYYGDIESNNPMQQCQVLNAKWLWPFQLFCFNFGSTHVIHHFVINEPFYIRQWTAKHAHEALRNVGVRFNDFGSMSRANRYYPVTADSK